VKLPDLVKFFPSYLLTAPYASQMSRLIKGFFSLELKNNTRHKQLAGQDT